MGEIMSEIMSETEKAATEYVDHASEGFSHQNSFCSSDIERAFLAGAAYEREQHKGDKVSKYMGEAEALETENRKLRSELADSEWREKQLYTIAKSWEADCDKLKAKYEPTVYEPTTSRERCCHDIHGEDCFKCYPVGLNKCSTKNLG